MSSNLILNKLAKERIARTTAPVIEAWTCPVCYTDGSSSGHVIPKCCPHKICLDCYSNILTKTTNCICPVCRAAYRPNSEPVLTVTPTPPPVVARPPVRRQLVIKDNFYFREVGGSITIGGAHV